MKPRIDIDRSVHSITLVFPKINATANVAGTVTLYRPSNSQLDQVIPLQLNTDLSQAIPTDRLAKGMWRMKIDWTAGDNTYFIEDSFEL